jgi:hypothetical protein
MVGSVVPEARSTAFAKPNPNDALQTRYSAIQAKVLQQAGMASILTDEARAKMRAVTSFFEATQVAQPDALGRIGLLEGTLGLNKQATITTRSSVSEIERLLKINPNARPAQTAKRTVTRSTSLSEAFAPRDKVSALSSRRAALEDRLKKIAEASDVLTDETRATMNEAVKYLGTIDVNGEDAEGRIGLLEDALNVHPPVYRGSASRGSTGATRGG